MTPPEAKLSASPKSPAPPIPFSASAMAERLAASSSGWGWTEESSRFFSSSAASGASSVWVSSSSFCSTTFSSFFSSFFCSGSSARSSTSRSVPLSLSSFRNRRPPNKRINPCSETAQKMPRMRPISVSLLVGVDAHLADADLAHLVQHSDHVLEVRAGVAVDDHLGVLAAGLERLEPHGQLRQRDLLLVVEDVALLG